MEPNDNIKVFPQNIAMRLRGKSALRKLVDEGLIAENDIKAFPSIIELGDAYAACGKELTGQLRENVQLLNPEAKDPDILGQTIAHLATSAGMILECAKILRSDSFLSEVNYYNDCAVLARHMKNITDKGELPAGIGVTLSLDQLLPHLPERTQEAVREAFRTTHG